MTEPDTGEWSFEVDVAVVGAGGCGLTAALRAAHENASVFVFEKMAVPLPNTARSTGMVPAAGTRWQRAAGIDDSPSVFVSDVMRKTHGQADARLADHLARASAPMVEWLVDRAEVELELVTGFTYPGHSRFRMHAPADRAGTTLMRDLRHAVDAREEIEVVVDAPATALVADDAGAVRGLVVRHGDAVERVRAGAVVLASNGFGANPDMVRRYCPAMADALYLGGEGSTGEAVVWGQALGARTAFLDAYQGHSSVAVPLNVLISYATVMEGGIIVNRDGERFGDETAGYSEFATQVIAQPGGTAVLVFDDRIHRLALAFEDYRVAVEAGALRTADSPAALAERTSVSPEGLERTLGAYAAAADGVPDAFGRADCRVFEPPLHAVTVTGALFHTQGGLVVDEHARVQREDGSTIAGLYAGGGAAEGISGHGASGYVSGNGLLSALGLGWLAGRHAATTVVSAR